MDSHSAYLRRRALSAALPLPRALRLEPEWAAWALLVAVGYYFAARIGLAFTLQPHPISTLWPPNALLLAALLLAPTRAWWLLLAAALPAHLLAELQSGVPTAMVLAWYVSNSSEALIGASLVRAFVPGALRLDSFRNAGVFVLGGALAAPLASSFLDAALVKLIGWGQGDYLDLVRMRFTSNVLAALTVAPLVLTWAAFGLRRLREVPARRCIEAAALFLGLLAASLVAFDLPLVDANSAPALFYAPLPFLLWAAVRLGAVGTASALALVVTVTIWGAVSGIGPFAGGEPRDTARDMQLFLTAIAVPLLLLSAALEERVRAAHDLREQRLQLTHLSRVALLGQLSGGLAHELNQPLTAILSNAQAAQRFLASPQVDREELGEILRDIIAADQRAGEVIRRLRALFKRGETEFQPLDVSALAREVLVIVHGDLVMRGVEVTPQLAESLPPVLGDRVELQQVLLNLVVNACEAMSAGAPERRQLSIRTAPDEDGVRISVIDRGPGFPAEQYPKLFQAFYTTKPQGLGLGLSISRSIVLAHGGRLWGSSIPGHGTSFHIYLPARPAGA